MIKRIHVNQHNIKANTKGANLPVLSVKTYKDNTLCNLRGFSSMKKRELSTLLIANKSNGALKRTILVYRK